MKKSQRPLERIAPRAGGDRPGGPRRFGGEGGEFFFMLSHFELFRI